MDNQEILNTAITGSRMWAAIIDAIQADIDAGNAGQTLREYKEQCYKKLKAQYNIRLKSHCAGCTVYSKGAGDCHARCRLHVECDIFLAYAYLTNLEVLLSVSKYIHNKHLIWIGELNENRE